MLLLILRVNRDGNQFFICNCEGFNGWFRDMMCALNDPRMKPHVFVVPLRGGDRMWMDCANPEACALETQIAKV